MFISASWLLWYLDLGRTEKGFHLPLSEWWVPQVFPPTGFLRIFLAKAELHPGPRYPRRYQKGHWNGSPDPTSDNRLDGTSQSPRDLAAAWPCWALSVWPSPGAPHGALQWGHLSPQVFLPEPPAMGHTWHTRKNLIFARWIRVADKLILGGVRMNNLF